MRVCVMPCAGGTVGTGRMLPDAFGMHLWQGRCWCSRGGMVVAADKGYGPGTPPPNGVVCGVCGCSGVVWKCDAVSARCEVTCDGVLTVCVGQSALCLLLPSSCCVKLLDQKPLCCAVLAFCLAQYGQDQAVLPMHAMLSASNASVTGMLMQHAAGVVGVIKRA